MRSKKDIDYRQRSKYKKKDFYKHYRNRVNNDGIYNVDYKTFTKVVDLFFHKCMTAMREENATIRFTPFIGEFVIVKHKPTSASHRPKFNYHHYNLTGQKTYYLNENTGGYYFFHDWKSPHNLRFAWFYKFKAQQPYRRYLKNAIKNKEFDTFSK